MRGQGPYGQPPHAPLQTHSTTNFQPPPAPGSGPKVMTETTQQRKPELFDMTINDHMMEAKEDTERELMEHSRKAKQKK